MGSLDSGHEEYTHACFFSKQGRGGDWNCMGSWPVSHDCSSSLSRVHPSLSRVPALVSLASQCSYTLEQRLPQLRGEISCDRQRWLKAQMAPEQSRGAHC